MTGREHLQNEFNKLVAEPFGMINAANIENIPMPVEPVLADVADALHHIYGTNGNLYLNGSVVSGGFRMDPNGASGLSDIDIVWIGAEPMPEGHLEYRRAALSGIDLRGVVSYIDATALTLEEISSMGRKSLMFALGYNGALYDGSLDIDFTSLLPKTKGDYFSCQYARFRHIGQLSRNGWDQDSLDVYSPRSMSKRMARAVFHDAYFRGCPYMQNLPQMKKSLIENGFTQEADLFQRYFDLSQRAMTEEEKVEVFTGVDILAPIFERIVAMNPTEYGQRVRDWMTSIE